MIIQFHDLRESYVLNKDVFSCNITLTNIPRIFMSIKVQSRVTSTFAFFFELCRPFLENGNDRCEHCHLLP